MNSAWYPLVFQPLVVPRPWGGTLLGETYARTPATGASGDTYDVVDAGEQFQTVVSNGPLAGATLRELVRRHAAEMVCPRHDPLASFPLRVRFLDVGQQMPLEVHPDDEGPAVPGALSLAKVWYVAGARPAARITVGITMRATQQQFVSRLTAGDLEAMLMHFPAEVGDAYYIPPGRVHALGAGVLALAIETNREPPLFVAPLDSHLPPQAPDPGAIHAIEFINRAMARIRRDGQETVRNRKIPLITLCPTFTVDQLRLVEPLFDRVDGRSFHLLTAVDGRAAVEAGDTTVELAPGGTCLLPAALGPYSVAPLAGKATMLRTALRLA